MLAIAIRIQSMKRPFDDKLIQTNLINQRSVDKAMAFGFWAFKRQFKQFEIQSLIFWRRFIKYRNMDAAFAAVEESKFLAAWKFQVETVLNHLLLSNEKTK